VGLPNQLVKETDQARRGHVRNRSECPSPNRKRPSTSLVESGERGARTANKRGKATVSSSSVEENGGGCHGEDSKPSLLTSSSAARRIGSSADQEVVQEQATTLVKFRTVGHV
jgi:hypothetical protein